MACEWWECRFKAPSAAAKPYLRNHTQPTTRRDHNSISVRTGLGKPHYIRNSILLLTDERRLLLLLFPLLSCSSGLSCSSPPLTHSLTHHPSPPHHHAPALSSYLPRSMATGSSQMATRQNACHLMSTRYAFGCGWTGGGMRS